MSIFDLPIFCINLKKDIIRKEFIQSQLRNKNLTFIDAIYGKNIEESKLNKLKHNSKKNHNHESLDTGEIGCLLSHIKVFSEALKSTNSEHIMVMEDDVNIITYYNKHSDKFILDHIHNYDCIQLSIIIGNTLINSNIVDFTCKHPHFLDWNEINGHSRGGGFWSTGCYIISRNAMSKLINKFISYDHLLPSDYYLYNSLNTGTFFPPMIYPIHFESSISPDDKRNFVHSNSYNFLTNNYHPQKLILITIWFGKLPDYFPLWVHTLIDKKYDVLFITDQTIRDAPTNLKILNMNLDDLNQSISKKMNGKIKIKNYGKLVDVKPLFGELFYNFIYGYEYWGWTDIDMLMGDIIHFISPFPEIEVFSFGFDTFGPMTIFKTSITDIYKQIECYDEILNDPFVCKVDEPWWFMNKSFNEHKKEYLDVKVHTRFYAGNKMIDYIKTKKNHTFDWSNICVDINWNIKEKKNLITDRRYTIKNNLQKNNREICFCHLTQLKLNKPFLHALNKLNKLLFFVEMDEIVIDLNYDYKKLIEQDTDSLNVYEAYDSVSTTCNITIKL
jgi:GR25 family glycosyltransferase involved in LPS biosynthesis